MPPVIFEGAYNVPTSPRNDRHRTAELDLRLALPIPRTFLGAATLAHGRGGIASVARMSAKALAAAGHAVTVTSYLDDAPVIIAGTRSAPTHRGKLRFVAACHRAALTHTHFVYDSAAMARAHPRLPGLRRPYAVWMHGVEAWEALRPPAEAALRNADLVLVNSRHTLERYQALHGELPAARVCWLGAETDEEPEPAAADAGPPTVLILARIDAGDSYKGHAELIAGWPQVTAAIPEARLLIAGGGSGLGEIRARAAASPVTANIDILGFVLESEIDGLWRRAHVFAMPSRGEGFGLVYIEAMRHGLPVIASAHDAGREVNVDGATGFNVSLDRPGELADQLIRLLGNAALRRRMGAAGLARWREHFRFSSFADRLLPLLEPFIGFARLPEE